MNLLITGGSGFIGTRLASDLLKNKHTVSIYNKRRSDVYPHLCTVADVGDNETLTAALKGVDAVYRLAAEHRDDVRPTSLYYDVNVGSGCCHFRKREQGHNVYELLSQIPCGKFVFDWLVRSIRIWLAQQNNRKKLSD